MKKLLILSLMVGLVYIPSAFAGNASGCGLGSIVWQGQKGLVPNLLAVTTNGTSASQTFGITSGTSNCDANATVDIRAAQEIFVAANLDSLSQDMAQGQGQYVEALAGLMGCPVTVRSDFSRMTQESYSGIFTSAQPDASAVIGSLKAALLQNPALAGSCTRVG